MTKDEPRDLTFPATRHTVIAELSSPKKEVRERAFADLAEAYWRPIYAYVRVIKKRQPTDAEDLTQGFFAAALEREFFADFDKTRARFRTFLRACLDRFVANQDRARMAAKRGENVTIRCDFADAEALVQTMKPRDDADPGDVFEKEWLRSFMANAIERLERRLIDCDRARDFRIFSLYDLAPDPKNRPSYADVARETGTDTITVTNRLYAARKELRAIILERLRRLTTSDDEYREEVRVVLGQDVP